VFSKSIDLSIIPKLSTKKQQDTISSVSRYPPFFYLSPIDFSGSSSANHHHQQEQFGQLAILLKEYEKTVDAQNGPKLQPSYRRSFSPALGRICLPVRHGTDTEKRQTHAKKLDKNAAREAIRHARDAKREEQVSVFSCDCVFKYSLIVFVFARWLPISRDSTRLTSSSSGVSAHPLQAQPKGQDASKDNPFPPIFAFR
jgi:hypothetical protein